MPSNAQLGLLLTRPEQDSRRFAALLPELRATISPILRIEPVDHDGARLRAAQGLVFTSAHAVATAGSGCGRLALCVGGRTAEVAQAAGFDVRVGNGFAESLLPLIRDAKVPLIHPHGRHLARELPVDGMVVYDQIARPLSDAARDLLAGDAAVVVPVFSPRSASLLSGQMEMAAAPLWVAAISQAAKTAWRAPLARWVVADTPTAEAMAAAVRRVMSAEQS